LGLNPAVYSSRLLRSRRRVMTGAWIGEGHGSTAGGGDGGQVQRRTRGVFGRGRQGTNGPKRPENCLGPRHRGLHTPPTELEAGKELALGPAGDASRPFPRRRPKPRETGHPPQQPPPWKREGPNEPWRGGGNASFFAHHQLPEADTASALPAHLSRSEDRGAQKLIASPIQLSY
jgi:hypothetical protein